MADGKVVIETDLDSSGIEKGLKKSEKSMKAQAANMAAEYRKQGMSASDAFKKAWSEIERGSSSSALTVKREFGVMGQSAEEAANHADQEWKTSSIGIGSAISKIGSITKRGLKIAATAITGTTTALSGIGVAAVKAGSDFEAQMSRVKAISGATGEEFEKLKDQAVKLGAETAFSSNEAAEGMENLAAAGFTTNEIMEAMPGLLDMAAASGEDLANSSEIAASTLRGFGLESKEAGHVADVLAENANRTNAAISDTGEAMKYVAPLARAAGIRFEETAAAIGIMANAGIKGSQAGTTLRGAISRLSKPTDDMRDAVEELGISFYDSNGKMKSLSEQVGMLEGAFSGMTDEQKNNYLVTLYGQEALSGMLALINEGQGSLTDLTKSYENCDGSAKKAADTMQDNLKGAIEELSGSAESLGIVFYEDVSDSLKETAKTATESINNITDAFENGGLEEAIETAGDEFANLAVKAAEHAPDMVDTAVDFIESFAKGLGKNKKKLIGAAGDMAETLAEGLADLLPDELERPVDEAIDAISDSLNSGGLKKAGKTVVTTFDNLIDAAGNLAEKALPPLTKGLDFATENLDVIAASATAAFTAFKGYKVITETTGVLSKGAKAWKSASDAVDVFNAAQLIAMESGIKSNATMTARQTVVGLLTGKITLATAAQTAWNAVMNANPIGLVITAVGALAAGLAVYKLATDDSKESQYALTEEQKKANEEIHKQYEAYKELDSARKKSMESINAEYGYLTELQNELEGLIDSNGQVKAGYEDRANFIVNQLSEALGIEKDKIWEIIQANGDLGTSIDQIIKKKKAEALLVANEEAYTEAIKNRADALKKYTDQTVEFETAQKNYNSTQEAANKVMDEYYSLLQTSPEAANAYLLASQSILKEADEAEAAFKKQKKALKEAEGTYVGYNATIQNYEGLSSAILSGDATKISEAMLNIQNSFITAETGTKTSLENQVKNMQENYAALKQAVEDGVPGVTQSMVEGAQQMVIASATELAKLPDGAATEIEALGPEASAAMASALVQADLDGKLGEESQGALRNFIDGFNGLDIETQKVWSQAWFGALEGLEGFEKLKDPAEDGVEAFLESLKNALEVHSPSRAVKAIFSQVWPGAVEGLGEGENEVSRKGKSVISNFFTELGGDKVVQNAKKLGNKVLNFFSIGIESQKGNIDKTSKEIADSSNKLLGSADTKKTGRQKGDEYNKGVGSNKSPIDKTSKNIADSSNAQLGSADTKGTGSRKSKEYDLGVGSNKSSIDLTSKNIADSSDTLLGSANTQRTGTNKSSEYNRGLGSNRGTIDSTSRGLSNTANSGMGSADTGITGKNLGNEYAVGIKDKTKKALQAAEELAKNADDGAAKHHGYDAGSGFGSGFVSGINSWIGSAVNAAANLASRALSAAKKAIDSHSPSKKTRKLGKYFGQGFELGIKGEEKNVEKESENLANIALDSLDMSAITERMHEVMGMNTNRVTRQITSQNIHVQHMISDERDRLSDREIQAIGKAIANVVNDHMEEIKIVYNNREFGRVVRGVNK